jgi:hypothetical protein
MDFALSLLEKENPILFKGVRYRMTICKLPLVVFVAGT